MVENFIKGYKKDSNITILNTIYRYPRKNLETGKYDDGRIILLYRDNNTGEKKIQEIENPNYTFYMANDDVYLDHHLFFIDKDEVTPITVPYKDVLKTIAEETNNTEFFYNNLKNRDRRANEQLHSLPNIFGSDINVEDAYRLYFDIQYKNEPFQITKAYFDIETDTINMKGDFPELGECPINAVSYINASTNKIYVFLLRDENNPLIEEFENEVKNGIIFNEFKQFLENHVGSKLYKKYGLNKFEYEMFFYDEEANLIIDLFRLINTCEPDFLLAWNMSFDIPYIIERCKVLGLDPDIVLSHPEAITKIATYYIDVRNKKLPAQRGDFFTINGKTVYLDQLVHFASRRKGQSAFDNLKLDNIGYVIAEIRKLDWSHIAKTFGEFPRTNYKLFVFYNIIDTIVQHCIEEVTTDIDYVFNKSLINNTRYHKAHRQTVYLSNRGVKEFYKDGYILCNNNNRNNEKPPKFPGAHVGDPLNNTDYSKLKINGKPINVANNLDDFDYKSLYPSVMREFNIAPNTQIGKILIDQQVHDNENPFKYEKYCRSGQFIEDYRSGNTIEFCHRWMHLANYEEFMEDMNEYFSMNGAENVSPMSSDLVSISRNNNIPKSNPLVRFSEQAENRSLVFIYPEEQDFSEEHKILTKTAQMDLNNIDKALRRREREKEEDEELNKVFENDTINNVNPEDEETEMSWRY